MIFPALALLAAVSFQTGKLDIKDTVEGSGRAAQAKDLVTMEYSGKLADGKEFDSSTGKPPIVFQLGSGMVIKGWDQGIVGMKVGGERDLTVPSDLGYGDAGAEGVIPPKATLKFHVKLLRIDREGDVPAIEQKVTAPGTGPAPVEGDVLDLHYNGTFLNGVKFDSSYDRNKPMQVITGHERLIKGFIEGIKGIKQGEKRRVVIPALLGYGMNPRGPIPGGSTLVFDIEAVKLTPKAEVAKQVEVDRKKLTIEEQAKGDGAIVRYGDIIQVHFAGSLPDGKSLGGTRESGQPFTYQVGSGQIVRGFDVALVGMKTGGKCKITIPSDLAYGDKGGANGQVPPKTSVIFELEVVKINP